MFVEPCGELGQRLDLVKNNSSEERSLSVLCLVPAMECCQQLLHLRSYLSSEVFLKKTEKILNN